jgi:hypothetical protein
MKIQQDPTEKMRPQNLISGNIQKQDLNFMPQNRRFNDSASNVKDLLANHSKLRQQMIRQQRNNFNRKSCEMRKSVDKVSSNNVAENIIQMVHNQSQLSFSNQAGRGRNASEQVSELENISCSIEFRSNHLHLRCHANRD